jgi:murein DD-endopeptidase MepM/ murein hydrolase activator NlpD
VCNGGADPAWNVHPHAYDFVRPYRGAGDSLEDYDAYGAEVLAPADGIVCGVVDGHPDAPPGRSDAAGTPNLLVLDHGVGEWSVLAHFQLGSFRLQVGRPAVRGQVLGLCGNSGDSSEPHIHIHLQAFADIANMWKSLLPLTFARAVVDGEIGVAVQPRRGQLVEAVRQPTGVR